MKKVTYIKIEFVVGSVFGQPVIHTTWIPQ